MVPVVFASTCVPAVGVTVTKTTVVLTLPEANTYIPNTTGIPKRASSRQYLASLILLIWELYRNNSPLFRFTTQFQTSSMPCDDPLHHR